MYKSLIAVTLFVTVAAFAATPALFDAATESKWTVASGGKTVGTVTLLTSSNGTRAEWRTDAKAPVMVLLGGNGKVWVRATGGDVELATMSAMTPEYTVLPALLLPFTTGTTDKVESKSGKVASYSYRGGAKATYRFDAQGPSAIDVTVAGTKYTATRTAATAKTADATQFTIRPRKTAASRLLAASDLLGPSNTGVSATAGGRGASGKGMKLADGGDYDALLQLENRDETWRKNLDAALRDFQKTGNVGRERGDQ